MAPKGKSSASSATRKKHARKSAGPSAQVDEPTIPKEKKAKGKEKKSKEPRKKVYIPPVKPTPVQPDPLDTLGLAQKLPPELLVVLRRLAKKDSITKRRALEEFQAAWVDKARSEGADGVLLSTLADTIPVWLHHVPALFLHPSRRIRLLAVGLHSSFLHLPNAVTEPLFFFLREVASSDQAEYIIGAWCIAAHDVDRQVSSLARESWTRSVGLSANSGKKLVLTQNLLQLLWEFTQRMLLDPSGVYAYVSPSPPAAPPPAMQRKSGARPPPSRKDEEASGRVKSEEEEEDEQDRRARLRIGAFGSAEWVLRSLARNDAAHLTDEFLAPFTDPALWSALYHAQTPPFAHIDSFGYAQPGVRKAAWSLLQTLLQTCGGHLQTVLPILSNAILRSAWVEPDVNVRGAMWQPLLTFLRESPNAWELSMQLGRDDADESGSEDSEDEDDARSRKSSAYAEFLQFLELGCGGAPLQGYPAVLIILSTIPPSIFASSSDTPLQDLFTSFWAVLDGRTLSALDRTATSAAFLSSLLECLVFLIRRIINSSLKDAASLIRGKRAEVGDDRDTDEESRKEAVKVLLTEQIGKVWEVLSTERLRVESKASGLIIAKNLLALYALDAELFRAAWDTLVSGIKSQVSAPEIRNSPLVITLLNVLRDRFEEGTTPKTAVETLIGEVVKVSIQQCENMLEAKDVASPERVSALVGILDAFGEALFADLELVEEIDKTIRRDTYRLLLVSPQLLLVYLSHRNDEQLCSQLWQNVLRAVSIYPKAIGTVLSPLLDAAEKGLLPSYLEPDSGSLDDLAGRLLVEALSGPRSTAETKLVQRILRSPDHFISRDCLQALVQSVCSAFTLHFVNTLHDVALPLDVFDTSLDLIQLLSDVSPGLLYEEGTSVSLLPDIFLFGYLLPRFRPVIDRQESLARALWAAWTVKAPHDIKGTTLTVLKRRIRELLLDYTIQPTPEEIVSMLSEDLPGLDSESLLDIFPPKAELDDMLNQLPSIPGDPSLAVVDDLVPPASLYEREPMSGAEYDHAGFSSYARVTYAYLLQILDDRHSARVNMWGLRHFLALSLYADEVLQIPSVRSPVFASQTPRSNLLDIVTKTRQMTTYLLSSVQEQEGWHAAVTGAILVDKGAHNLDGIGRLVVDLIQRGIRGDAVRESRILHIVLQHILGSVSKADAERWMVLARKLEKQAPQTSLAIVYSITRYAPEPPTLVRYRNELAASMLGVPASKANTDGLWILRRLAATAPDPESDIVFLPQPRAVNLMKVCQQWITSDEDLDEEVEAEMSLVFFHLVPILQNVPGAHWELIFDVLESNLENSSLAESSTLVTMSRSLRLFIAIQDLASTNKALRAVWQERETVCLALVRDLAATKLDVQKTSTPLSICRELALEVVQNLPESLVDKTTLPKMCHIVADSSVDVQKKAYQLLHEAARKYTEHVVIEAAVDSEITMKSELPLELIDILQWNLNYEDILETKNQEASGYFLAWMLAFDLFSNASLKVKSGYIDQLRDLGLVGERLLPNIFSILALYEGIPKAFRLDIWAVDEYYLDLYSADSPISLRLLAAHLYYRALMVVPSLIRNWLSECRDRQLFNAVTAYTACHFSPAIIKTGLSQIRELDPSTDLLDENFTIKVANSINEVTASYVVDEHRLEIAIKLPPDYPLHGIELRDNKKVGVPDERWRAWMLGVQQILSFRSGSILDGVSFFKKNVASHFEGLAECAICYSIISATDGSLPRKPCMTCKNRFHAGCLYKWFSSSHSSSCPLCRSEITI